MRGTATATTTRTRRTATYLDLDGVHSGGEVTRCTHGDGAVILQGDEPQAQDEDGEDGGQDDGNEGANADP